MQPLPNEPDLIERAQKGDKGAASTLYEIYVQRIFQYISYRVESDAIAEDLTADVFLRMIRGLSDYRYTGAPFGAWLFRIAANRIADHYREIRPAALTSITEETIGAGNDLFDDFTQEEERSSLRQALQTLSEDYQNILILRFMKDLSHNEVATIMGKSEAAVRVMQHRALKALAAVLGQASGDQNEEQGNQNV